MTDGEDRTSKIKEKQLTKEIKGIGVKVYAIGLVEELESAEGFTISSQRAKVIGFLKNYK